jgi:CRISPR-associated protein Cst1
MYFKYHNIDFQCLYDADEIPKNAITGFDGIMYNQSDIEENKYLEFVEHYFESDMTHLQILNILENDEFDEQKVSLVNSLVNKKTVLKSLFSDKKFDGKNKDYYVNQINSNRLKIVKEIFRFGQNLYSDYSNKNLLFTQDNAHCRLLGYTVDEGRKTKYLGFCFSKESFVANDIPEFDFIPFAFSKTYESYFINNNFSIQSLVKTKQYLDDNLSKVETKNPRNKLYILLKSSGDFINYDVEVVSKSIDEDVYKTMFIRYKYLKALKSINANRISFKWQLAEGYWFDLEKEVYEHCLNGVYLDDIIERMLKYYFIKDVNKGNIKYCTDVLVNLNESWKGNLLMKEIDMAKKMGYLVSCNLISQKKGNKVISYKQKIIGALVAHDYDRVNEVILSLAAYVGMEFAFAYPLFENPEENKNIAFAFANALTDTKKSDDTVKEN